MHTKQGKKDKRCPSPFPFLIRMSSVFNKHSEVSLADDSVFHYLDTSIPKEPWDCLRCPQLAWTLFAPLGFDDLS